MGKVLQELDAELKAWVGAQRMFFVASAPRADGHVNLSPKGGDSFRVLSGSEFCYCDFTGSGIETAAHVRENGRIVVMFCAFDGPPRILRIHGTARAIPVTDPEAERFSWLFPENPGVRLYLHITATRIATSCGYSIPRYAYLGERDVLDQWTARKGPQGLEQYRRERNRVSIDGLPGLEPG